MQTRFSDAAILALHYQNENCHPEGKIRFGLSADEEDWRQSVLDAAKRLFAGARAHAVPLIHVQLVTQPGQTDVVSNCRVFRRFIEIDAWPVGSWGAAFIEGLEPREDEIVVTHGRNNAFYASRLDEYMNALRPRRLIVTGVSTAYVVESTVRHAVDAGYEVIVGHDACATYSRIAHEASLQAMSLLAAIAGVDEILAALARPDGLDHLMARHFDPG